ncbi:hypothetical protein [uncultured Vagococcus sp.]|uniref:hypothetical protein n=1 Tax=uncultured Vagococcus sp. TaxID=189676 RepID=UPI0028D3F18E|nr:hypothetical protein [uncultured Vagococcus sp.]
MLFWVKRMCIKLYMFSVIYYEKKFVTAKCTLRYLFFKKKGSRKLLVVFSAYPGFKQQARYNYIMTFRRLNYHRLYILDDFGPENKGAYYLGQKSDFYISKAVLALIESRRIELGLEKEEVITCGSSKGGYAAMYFEAKGNYLASISGAPQTLLGNYLNRPIHLPIFTFIMGQANAVNHHYLNELLFQAIKDKQTKTQLFVHVSKEEHTYGDHILPLLDVCHIKELNLGSYSNHSSVGQYFPKYALTVLNKLEEMAERN